MHWVLNPSRLQLASSDGEDTRARQAPTPRLVGVGAAEKSAWREAAVTGMTSQLVAPVTRPTRTASNGTAEKLASFASVMSSAVDAGLRTVASVQSVAAYPKADW